jgi:hypothetical protein
MFFGINITCCQCHTHPYVDTLSQDYFFGMKAFFSRSYEFQGKLFEKQFGATKVQFKTDDGESREVGLMFLTGAVVETPDPGVPDLKKAITEENKRIEELKKKFGKEKKFPAAPNFSPRGQLVKLAETPQSQRLIARSIVNRLWHRFYGRGLVMRVDQMHAENSPSHPELLEWLSRDLIAHGWDLRRLAQGLVSSQAYSRSSRWTEGKPPQNDLFAVAELRPLTPPQFGMSVLLLGNSSFALPPKNAEELLKRIVGLEQGAQGFSSFIDRPQLDLQINVSEPLKMSNDTGLLRITSRLVPQLMKLDDPRQQVESAVWSVLGRPPTPREVELLRGYLADHSTLSAAERARFEQEAAAHREEVTRAQARAAEIEAELKALDDAESVLSPGSAGWKYTAAAGLSGDVWLRPDFDDGSWKAARTPAGYGQPFIAQKQGTTLELKEQDIAFRREFQLDDARFAAGKGFKLRIAADDSAAVWINGKLVDDDKAVHDAVYWNRDLDLPGGVLVAGRNVVAVRLRNAKASPDAVLDLQIARPNPESLAQRDKLNAELNETRKLAATPVPRVPTDAELARKAREHMVWALVAGPEFRFNH